jgi:hypothetical protein
VDQDGPLVINRTGEVHSGDVETQVLDEPRSEHEFPYPRVQSIRTNDEIETTRRGMLECDVHAVSIIGQRDDGVRVEIVGVVPSGVCEDGGKVAARDLDAIAQLHRHPPDPATPVFDRTESGRPRRRCPHPR